MKMRLDLQSSLKWDTVTFVLSWVTIFSNSGVTSGVADVQKHLEMGRMRLENRQFSDALTHFHAAVEGDPNNYQTYFRRALVFIALGKYNQALNDFDKVIELKSDFSAAILQRANLILKQGQLDQAYVDFLNVLRMEPDNPDALNGRTLVKVARKLKDEAKYYADLQICGNAVERLTRLINTCPWDPELRRLRSECYLSLGDAPQAISDLRFITRLVMDDTDAIYRLSSLQYQLGELEESLREIRKCLKFDPEHKLCFPLYKTLKKLDKLFQDATKAEKNHQFGDCVSDIKKALMVDPKLPRQMEFKLRHKLCWCHLKGGEGSLAADQCTNALDINEDDETLCDRADAYLLQDLFDKAIRDFKRAHELNDENRRAAKGVKRAQNLKKQSKEPCMGLGHSLPNPFFKSDLECSLHSQDKFHRTYTCKSPRPTRVESGTQMVKSIFTSFRNSVWGHLLRQIYKKVVTTWDLIYSTISSYEFIIGKFPY